MSSDSFAVCSGLGCSEYFVEELTAAVVGEVVEVSFVRRRVDTNAIPIIETEIENVDTGESFVYDTNEGWSSSGQQITTEIGGSAGDTIVVRASVDGSRWDNTINNPLEAETVAEGGFDPDSVTIECGSSLTVGTAVVDRYTTDETLTQTVSVDNGNTTAARADVTLTVGDVSESTNEIVAAGERVDIVYELDCAEIGVGDHDIEAELTAAAE